jgi:DNA-binding MarR family transcriptional regulator
MADLHAPTDADPDAAAIDIAAESLLSVWDAAREATAARVSGSQLRAMLVVEEFDGINLRGLATQLGVILSSASRLCDRLVAAGVVEGAPGQHDRREIALHLTTDGHKLLHALRDERRRRLAAVLARMSPAGRQALVRGLTEFGDVLSDDARSDEMAEALTA